MNKINHILLTLFAFLMVVSCSDNTSETDIPEDLYFQFGATGDLEWDSPKEDHGNLVYTAQVDFDKSFSHTKDGTQIELSFANFVNISFYSEVRFPVNGGKFEVVDEYNSINENGFTSYVEFYNASGIEIDGKIVNRVSFTSNSGEIELSDLRGEYLTGKYEVTLNRKATDYFPSPDSDTLSSKEEALSISGTFKVEL